MEQQLYRFVKANERMPEIDNKNPKHFVFVNDVNHQSVNIWTEFIDEFPPLIRHYIRDWVWIEPIPTGKEVSAEEVLDNHCSSLPAWSPNRKINVLKAMEIYASQFKGQPIDQGSFNYGYNEEIQDDLKEENQELKREIQRLKEVGVSKEEDKIQKAIKK